MTAPRIRMFCTLFLLLFGIKDIIGQDFSETNENSKRLSLALGPGKMAIRDKAISDERYTGNLSSFFLNWQSFRTNRLKQIGFDFLEGSDIQEGNLSAQVVLFSLSLDNLFTLKPIQILNKPMTIYLGPSTGTDIYIRQQNIAFNSPEDDAVSVLWKIPLGIKSRVFIPIGSKITIESGLILQVVSFAIRFPSNTIDEFDAKLLSPTKGFNMDFDLTTRYNLLRRLNTYVSFSHQIQNMTGWDEQLLLARANAGAGLQFRF